VSGAERRAVRAISIGVLKDLAAELEAPPAGNWYTNQRRVKALRFAIEVLREETAAPAAEPSCLCPLGEPNEIEYDPACPRHGVTGIGIGIGIGIGRTGR
jgi:hypothetical protein